MQFAKSMRGKLVPTAMRLSTASTFSALKRWAWNAAPDTWAAKDHAHRGPSYHQPCAGAVALTSRLNCLSWRVHLSDQFQFRLFVDVCRNVGQVLFARRPEPTFASRVPSAVDLYFHAVCCLTQVVVTVVKSSQFSFQELIATMLRIEYPSLVIAFASFWTILSSCEAAVFGPLCATDDTLAKTFALARASLQITEEVRLQFLETSLCQLYSVVSSSTEHIGHYSEHFLSVGNGRNDKWQKELLSWVLSGKKQLLAGEGWSWCSVSISSISAITCFSNEEETVETRIGSLQLRQNKTTTGLCASWSLSTHWGRWGNSLKIQHISTYFQCIFTYFRCISIQISSFLPVQNSEEALYLATCRCVRCRGSEQSETFSASYFCIKKKHFTKFY